GIRYFHVTGVQTCALPIYGIKYYKERYNPNRWERIKLGVNQNYSKRRSWILEPQIIFNQTYGKINIDALIGGTFQDNKSNFLSKIGRASCREGVESQGL